MSAWMRRWAWWTLGFVAFPLAGLAGRAIAGPIDDVVAAVVGGAVTGAVLGAGQSLAGRGLVRPARWIPATGLGLAVGLALGTSTVGHATSLSALVLGGLLTGVPLGIAQALALPSPVRRRWIWALTTPALWGLGWTVTTVVGIDVVAQYTLFGSTGAITVSALSGLVLLALTAPGRAAPSAPGRIGVHAPGG
jgi:hypothetical protein